MVVDSSRKASELGGAWFFCMCCSRGWKLDLGTTGGGFELRLKGSTELDCVLCLVVCIIFKL